jgi:hypothetical protein
MHQDLYSQAPEKYPPPEAGKGLQGAGWIGIMDGILAKSRDFLADTK